MMGDREVVAIAVYTDGCERLPDGSLLIHDCLNSSQARRLVAAPADIAPWPDAERLASLQAERDRLAEQVAALGEQSGETCQDCGQKYSVEWWAPHDLWGRVVGDRWRPENGIYFLCVRCFDRRADALGIALCWSPWPVDAETPAHEPVSYVERVGQLEARLALRDAVVEAAREAWDHDSSALLPAGIKSRLRDTFRDLDAAKNPRIRPEDADVAISEHHRRKAEHDLGLRPGVLEEPS